MFDYSGGPMALWQRSLFDLGDQVGLAPLGSELGRCALGDGAWVDYRPNWVLRPDLLFERLVDEVPWRAERRPMYQRTVDVPRLVSFYDEGAELPHPTLDEARQVLGHRYATEATGPLRTVGACLYREGSDSVAWHSDRTLRAAAAALVAIVSLGARRRFLLRPASGGPARRYDLGDGDLLVMGGTCQKHFEHSVPKTSRPVEPRISVQFRTGGAA
jgi:alkylated DNA repair dioxygenase AlkB